MNQDGARRAFVHSLVVLLGILGLPRIVRAQSPRRVGVVLVGFTIDNKLVKQFSQGLRDAGYIEGRDIMLDWRSAEGDYSQVPAFASELIKNKVDLIVVDSTIAALALKRATSTIPIVMAVVADPLGSGLVSNFAHPGQNITGMSQMVAELHEKRLQLLKEVMPRLNQVGVLWNPGTQWHARVIDTLRSVAPSLAIKLKVVGAPSPTEFEPAFAAFSRANVQALYVIEDAAFFSNRTKILEQTAKHRLPASFGTREFADGGGLMSYGASLGDLWRRASIYVDKILKGAKPGDLPIEQPTRFEFVVNLKTAELLGLKIPEAVLLRADEVIR